MNVSIYQAAAALSAHDRAQELIADNLASSSIPGFKKQTISFAAVQAGMMPFPALAANGLNQHFLLPRTISATDFEPGQMNYTGVKTDVAIDGAGLFEIRTPGGATLYTRAGEFKMDLQGQLVTREGYTVIGQGGPIQFDPARRSEPIRIAQSGEISQGDTLVGKLKVVLFNDPQLLTRLNTGYFAATNPNLQQTVSTDTRICQGLVESSNATPMREMALLLQNIRQYETNQRVIQMNDERLGRAITEIGMAG